MNCYLFPCLFGLNYCLCSAYYFFFLPRAIIKWLQPKWGQKINTLLKDLGIDWTKEWKTLNAPKLKYLARLTNGKVREICKFHHVQQKKNTDSSQWLRSNKRRELPVFFFLKMFGQIRKWITQAGWHRLTAGGLLRNLFWRWRWCVVALTKCPQIGNTYLSLAIFC